MRKIEVSCDRCGRWCGEEMLPLKNVQVEIDDRAMGRTKSNVIELCRECSDQFRRWHIEKVDIPCD